MVIEAYTIPRTDKYGVRYIPDCAVDEFMFKRRIVFGYELYKGDVTPQLMDILIRERGRVAAVKLNWSMYYELMYGAYGLHALDGIHGHSMMDTRECMTSIPGLEDLSRDRTFFSTPVDDSRRCDDNEVMEFLLLYWFDSYRRRNMICSSLINMMVELADAMRLDKINLIIDNIGNITTE
jgi:hypothetical protein